MPHTHLAMCINVNYVLSPVVVEFWEDKAKAYGPILSGALFGAGWWFWVDAVLCNSHTVPFDQYIPGIIATLALIMINCIRRDSLQGQDAFDDESFCRIRLWLFLSYVVSFGSIVASVWVMILHYTSHDELSGAEKWPGVACIFQTVFILGSGILFFLSRTPLDGDYDGYANF